MADGAEGVGPAVTWHGGCQCGAVRYRIHADRLTAYACHCRECQKQSASAFGLSVPVLKRDLVAEGRTASWSRPTDSGSITHCHFCPACGSRVYHAGESRSERVTIKGGSLDTAAELSPVAHIWTASKQDWVQLPEGVPQWLRQPEGESEWLEMIGWKE